LRKRKSLQHLNQKVLDDRTTAEGITIICYLFFFVCALLSLSFGEEGSTPKATINMELCILSSFGLAMMTNKSTC